MSRRALAAVSEVVCDARKASTAKDSKLSAGAVAATEGL